MGILEATEGLYRGTMRRFGRDVQTAVVKEIKVSEAGRRMVQIDYMDKRGGLHSKEIPSEELNPGDELVVDADPQSPFFFSATKR